MSEQRATNRREFLRGQSAAEALAHLTEQGAVTDSGAGASSQSPYLVRVGRRAMACEFEVLVNAGQYEAATDQALAALDLVDELESQLTVYHDTSELARINRQAADTAVAIEPRLFELLRLAQSLYDDTEGAFDITSGPLSRAWGFSRREGRIPSDEERVAALDRLGMQHVQLNTERHSVRFAKAGIELNLGSIGKGYALDRVAELLIAVGIRDFMLHGGQSSILARGSEGGDGQGWSVGVVDPLRPGQRVATLRLQDRALGTSGASTQFFRHDGRRFGHILDPRTGWPAEGVLSTTVLADSGARADALATAFYVLGVERALEFCQRHPEVAAVILAATPGSRGCEVHTAGFGEEEIRLTRT